MRERNEVKMTKRNLFVGTYSKDTLSEGIYVFPLEKAEDLPGNPAVVEDLSNPSFLAFSADHKYLYACEELTECGSVSAFRLSDDKRNLEKLNTLTFPGAASCHVTVSPNGKYVLVSNFLSGTIDSCSVYTDGRLNKVVSSHEHIGSSIRTDWNQDHARCHEAVFTPDGKQVLVMDLGADKIVVYNFDEESGAMDEVSQMSTKPGDGPRHAVFNKSGSLLYVTCEISNQMLVCDYDKRTMLLREIQRISTLPNNFEQWSITAEIQLTKDERFIYISNRGHNSIVKFELDYKTGLPSSPEFFPTEGDEPRMFAFDPDETYCMIANQRSNNIMIRTFDSKNGKIGNCCAKLQVPQPTFVKIIS